MEEKVFCNLGLIGNDDYSPCYILVCRLGLMVSVAVSWASLAVCGGRWGAVWHLVFGLGEVCCQGGSVLMWEECWGWFGAIVARS